MSETATRSPDWNHLFEILAAQEGLFTTQQAAEAGYSPQLLAHHLGAGRMIRVSRGVYRLVHFPAGDREDLTAVWLWSEQQGVISHQTALALHDLSDVLPVQIHLTLSAGWHKRRLRVPDGIVLHYGDITKSERRWVGAVPVTDPLRTLKDCAEHHLSPDLLRAAARDALDRGLVTRDQLAVVDNALASFGGLES